MMTPLSERFRNLPANATALVGDVGGTNCRLALASYVDGHIRIANIGRYKCADFAGAEDAIDHYLRSLGWQEPLVTAVLAIAGPIRDGVVQSTNMSWFISEDALTPGVARKVKLINDYTALGLSVDHLGAADLLDIGPHVQGDQDDSVAIIGAGTGLGVGALARGVGGTTAIATEGGHISFAPVDAVEIEILRILTRRFGRVSMERLLCGPGMINIHAALCEIEGSAPSALQQPEDIVRLADAGDLLCQKTLERFCGIYGSMAGDVALLFGARGGVLLGGGIAPSIANYLQAGSFRQRFEDKGRFRDYLAAIPTRIIVYADAALRGCAFLALSLRDEDAGKDSRQAELKDRKLL